MTIQRDLARVLAQVLPNTWAVTLPRQPRWPAAVFEIESVPEDGWCAGVKYERHTVTVVVLSDDLDPIGPILQSMEAALEAMPGYLQTIGKGDGNYEDNAQVYACFLEVELRTRTL